MIVGPKLLSDVSRGIFVILYIIMIAGACYKASQVKVYFTQMYFVSDSSEIKNFLVAEEQYFKVGGDITTTYIEAQDA